MSVKQQIIRKARDRKRMNFVHFTNADNLLNIIIYGLLPRQKLDANDVEYVFNDDLRLDLNILV